MEARFLTTEDENHEASLARYIVAFDPCLVDRICPRDPAKPAWQTLLGLPGLPQYRVVDGPQGPEEIQARGDRIRPGWATRQGRLRGVPSEPALLLCRHSLRRLPQRHTSRAIRRRLSELPLTAELAEPQG